MSGHRIIGVCALLATVSFVAGGMVATWLERSRQSVINDRELAESIDRNLLTLERLAAGDMESIRATARIGVDTGWVQIRRLEDAGNPVPQALQLYIERLRARTAAVAGSKDGA